MDPIFKSIKDPTTVLELAVYLEEQGINFYQNQAQAVQDPALKSVYQFLADEEAKHRQSFIGLLEGAGTEYLELEKLVGEYRMFMDLLVKEAALLLNIDKSKTSREVLDAAIQFEKNTLLLYYDIATLLDENAVKTIMQICEEEKKHIVKLTGMK